MDHGVRDNAGFRFPPTSATLATLLKERGYATGAFISAFPLDSRFGLARGFDVYEDSVRGRDAADAAAGTGTARGRNGRARAKRWLDAHAAGPAFTWVHLFEPHAPVRAAGTVRLALSRQAVRG